MMTRSRRTGAAKGTYSPLGQTDSSSPGHTLKKNVTSTRIWLRWAVLLVAILVALGVLLSYLDDNSETTADVERKNVRSNTEKSRLDFRPKTAIEVQANDVINEEDLPQNQSDSNFSEEDREDVSDKDIGELTELSSNATDAGISIVLPSDDLAVKEGTQIDDANETHIPPQGTKKAAFQMQTLPYAFLQRCINDYTSKGFWSQDKWVVPNMNPHCGFDDKLVSDDDILSSLQNLTIGFMGDSTIRSDIRTFEERFQWPRTNLDEAQVFQRKANGSYVCDMWEQSINLTKCGIPPIVNTQNFRYFYKVYPWTPLDEWYFREVPELFHDIDVLVISVGRWLRFYQGVSAQQIEEDMGRFVVKLKEVFPGVIIYESEYAEHTTPLPEVQFPVNCTHGLFLQTQDCVQTVTMKRPWSDIVIQSVLKRHEIVHLDRWNVSKTLPLEHYEPWLCGQSEFHSWDCDHHLGFVGLQHFRLLVHVINSVDIPEHRASSVNVTEVTAKVNENFNTWMEHSSDASTGSGKQPVRVASRNLTLPYRLLQRCVDDYTSKGFWSQDKWVVPNMNPHCGFDDKLVSDDDILSTLQNLSIGFMGDSTIRSDIRAFEERFQWPRTNLDEAQVFQRKANGSYICDMWEQSINLTKCGIPPIVNTQNFRYFYKIYPWTPLDEWYFEGVPVLFQDLDVVVISIGRWLKYLPEMNEQKLLQDMDRFLVNLKRVFSGIIVYESEYSGHTTEVAKVQHPFANCSHGLYDQGQFDCVQTTMHQRPWSDAVLRSVMARHEIPHLDRWNISITPPLEYYETWLCDQPKFSPWYCDHHLGFVAMEHFRLLTHVVS